MRTTEQFALTQKANVQTLLELTHTAMEGVKSLVGVNLQAARTTLADAEKSILAKLSANDLSSLFAPQPIALQPFADNTAAYVRQAYDIAASMRAEVHKVLGAAAAKARASFLEICDAAALSVPPEAETSIALLTSTTIGAFDGLQKAAEQVADIAETNSAAVTAQTADLLQLAGEVERT